jgi:rod shape-determining protein MreC
MKALITRRSIIIASTALLLAIIAIVSVNVFNSAGPVTGVANAVTMPVRALASTVARTFGNIYSALYRYEDLERQNDELRRQVAHLQENFRDAEQLALENDRLRDLLDFRERHSGYTLVMATLADWTGDNWSRTFTISRGYSNSEIARGMPVTTEYGVLIGQVSSVGATTSTVITILDTTFSAAAFVGGDGSDETAVGSATVKGDFAFMRSGLLILDHIDDDLSIIPGTDVFTSGAGAVFPSGLTVGTVVSVFTHASGIGRYATVRPAVAINDIQTVFVIVDFENLE